MEENQEKKCAYCGRGKESVKFTKEHVVAHTFLNKYYPPIVSLNKNLDKKKKKLFQVGGYQNSIQKDSCNYQTIADVCSECNNGVLSSLDSYFLDFYDKNTDCKLKKQGKINTLNYNYSLLSRWLLKTMYNSERKNGYTSIVQPYLHNFKNYILSNEQCPDYEFQLYFECLKDHEKISPRVIYRNSLKNGLLKLSDMIIPKGLCYTDIKAKTFISDNYAFFIFVKPKKSSESIDQLVSDLNYYLCIELYKIAPEKEQIEYKVSTRSIVDLLKVSKEGNLWSTERYLLKHS